CAREWYSSGWYGTLDSW
nr:immunoglobulin heavy chain junction region [Macaca mulatta]MPN69928.1 immunoglobulin heavy chain junction region [Macaca mulatta]MPN69968.1 immunoglobulin heavy chain junction region [Macaca mulatta]MPN71924.1 immunoglobulin heavy chain junction region [Macaca mulatta]MPN72202.1 immunoglobulin heavy chain junction region [Macaca mulatta]